MGTGLTLAHTPTAVEAHTKSGSTPRNHLKVRKVTTPSVVKKKNRERIIG